MKRFSIFGGAKPRRVEATAVPEVRSHEVPVVGGSEHTAVEAEPADAGLSRGEPGECPTERSFGFVDAESRASAAAVPSTTGAEPGRPDGRRPPCSEETPAPRTRGLLPGSDGEHGLQCQFGSEERAHGFYARQVLDYLSPSMQDFITRQEILFVATADRQGECDCTSKFGQPGFIRVLNDKYLIYPEYRGNGVFANLGNITENPHIAMLILDLYRDTVGLHVNGKARIIDNDELLNHRDNLPTSIMDEHALEGKRRPERWVMVEVEEAYIQCSKHIPLMRAYRAASREKARRNGVLALWTPI
jgi:predicted pyridoxine 5'-phosphate oxidase superfamily flavin-nucleotide-binding protein